MKKAIWLKVRSPFVLTSILYQTEKAIFAKTHEMKQYKHLFFDLDRTLWDFERNASEAYSEIYEKYDLRLRGVENLDHFVKCYLKHNDELWALYRDGKIEKEYLRWRRFEVTLNEFGIDDRTLAQDIGNDYVALSPQKKHLLPNALQTLDYLHNKYKMHIITNGFEEVQFVKLANSNLHRYFQHVITSEAAGFKKPDPGIFQFALNRVGALAADCLMIGDDIETDIFGASGVGMDAVFFNPAKVAGNNPALTQIADLIELTQIL